MFYNQVISGEFRGSDVIFVPKIKTLFIKSISLTNDNIQICKLVKNDVVRNPKTEISIVEILWKDKTTSLIQIEKQYCKYLNKNTL